MKSGGDSTTNISDLVILISSKTGIPRSDVKNCIEAFIDITIAELSQNHVVRLIGFGYFKNVFYKSRKVNVENLKVNGKNLDAGEHYSTPRIVPKFVVTKNVRDCVSNSVGKLTKEGVL